MLDTGHDLVIFDFEGESRRPVLERRLKRPALEDVAAMLRSLHEATVVARVGDGPNRIDAAKHAAALDGPAAF